MDSCRSAYFVFLALVCARASNIDNSDVTTGWAQKDCLLRYAGGNKVLPLIYEAQSRFFASYYHIPVSLRAALDPYNCILNNHSHQQLNGALKIWQEEILSKQ